MQFIVIAFVCLSLNTVLSYLKSNRFWVNRKPADRKLSSREVMRAWRFNTALTSPDPWIQPR
jgi:uncharacterized protein (DUF2384 family)